MTSPAKSPQLKKEESVKVSQVKTEASKKDDSPVK
jgi:hypothetical protein